MHMLHTLPCKAVHLALLQSARLQRPGCFCYFHRRTLIIRLHSSLTQHFLRHSFKGVSKRSKLAKCTAQSPAQPHTSTHRSRFLHSDSPRDASTSWICRALLASQNASTAPEDLTAGIRAVLSDTEGSDDDEGDSTSDAIDLPASQLDEAVTGYMQDEAASTRVVKSKAEAHDQVTKTAINRCQNRFDISSLISHQQRTLFLCCYADQG